MANKTCIPGFNLKLFSLTLFGCVGALIYAYHTHLGGATNFGYSWPLHNFKRRSSRAGADALDKLHGSMLDTSGQSEVDDKTTLMCLVGGLRSFAHKQAHQSIIENVFLALGGPKSVDVHIILAYEIDDGSNGAYNGGAQACYDNRKISHAIEFMQPNVVHILRRGSCSEYQSVWKGAHCMHSNGFIQMALVHQCFAANTERVYKYYIRVRPDSYFSKPIPSLGSLQPGTVTTWPKFDAPGSDQFFIFPRELFDSWWMLSIKQRVESGTFSCCPEYDIFSSVQVSQRQDIFGCLLRDAQQLQCWRSEDKKNNSLIQNSKYLSYEECRYEPNMDELLTLLGRHMIE